MPLPATYTKVTLHFHNTNDFSKANCVLWYLIDTGPAPTLATVSAFAGSFKTAYSSAVGAALNENAEVQKVTVKFVTGGTEVEGDNTNGVIVGTVSGETLPEEDVLCIQRRTGLVGRSKRGRIFFPYISEEFQGAGELSATGITAAAQLATMVKSNVVHSGTTFKPQTPDWKNSLLVPVVQAGYVMQICSRRDRRFPKVLDSVRV